jgi:hypothetical protein
MSGDGSKPGHQRDFGIRVGSQIVGGGVAGFPTARNLAGQDR